MIEKPYQLCYRLGVTQLEFLYLNLKMNLKGRRVLRKDCKVLNISLRNFAIFAVK